MALKVKKTRPELLAYRRSLAMVQRYLPTLTLKKQQLQLEIVGVRAAADGVRARMGELRERMGRYAPLLSESIPGSVLRLVEVVEVRTGIRNVAGVPLPVLNEVVFCVRPYSRRCSPPWVDRAVEDLQAVQRLREELKVLAEQVRLLQAELRKVTQRVNLFEKVKIPQGREAIRVIRVALAEEQTAAVGRAKIAKGKIVGVAA